MNTRNPLLSRPLGLVVLDAVAVAGDPLAGPAHQSRMAARALRVSPSSLTSASSVKQAAMASASRALGAVASSMYLLMGSGNSLVMTTLRPRRSAHGTRS